MHMLQSLFYLTIALHVSGIIITHLQEKFNSIYYSVPVTRCCSYSCFVLLKMGDNDTRNM